MQVLVGWDDQNEAETIELLLNVAPTTARVVTNQDEFECAVAIGNWDVVLFAFSPAASFRVFQKVRQRQPQAGVIIACQSGEMVHLAKFISHGLHSYITRDSQGDFIFLLPSAIHSAYEMAHAVRARELAARLTQEVDSVRKMQEQVIPQDLPMPAGYRIAACYEPSQIRAMGDRPVVLAGGDYYDVFSLDGRNLIIIVGDAAGHGIKACMSIMSMHTLIRTIRENRYQDTAHFMWEVNRRLSDNAIVQGEGGFITLLYCALDTSSHRLQWTSAGHPLPILQNLHTNEVTTLGTSSGGMPLGINDDETYTAETITIPDECRILFYSDGLADAFGTQAEGDDRFGEKGIVATLKASADLTVEQTLKRLFDDSSAFTEGQGRHDDTSAVLLERHQKKNGG